MAFCPGDLYDEKLKHLLVKFKQLNHHNNHDTYSKAAVKCKCFSCMNVFALGKCQAVKFILSSDICISQVSSSKCL